MNSSFSNNLGQISHFSNIEVLKLLDPSLMVVFMLSAWIIGALLQIEGLETLLLVFCARKLFSVNV